MTAGQPEALEGAECAPAWALWPESAQVKLAQHRVAETRLKDPHKI